ncbi:MAG: hypothetical protein H6R17_3357 [Proteobacteria bacterium]|nr:hypothetical protein [Pseudomonadota bacterium]
MATVISSVPARRSVTTRRRLHLVGAAILLAGWIGAAAIYVNAGDESGDALGYEFVNGVAYPIQAYESKAYRHDLERFGGKAAIMADDFNRWFSGLWVGKHLAYTLATLASGGALLCFLAARRRPEDD